jgi:DNA-binding HxlR family transcriptional regulator
MKTARSFSALAPGSQRVLDLFIGKWAIRIVHALARGTKRHGELRRSLGASQKMLTQTLRGLERAGLVERDVHASVPPSVEYSLTKLGRTFVAPLNALCYWARRHSKELDAVAARRQKAAPSQPSKPARTLRIAS